LSSVATTAYEGTDCDSDCDQRDHSDHKEHGFEILIVIWRRPYGWAKFLSPLCADPLFDDASA
jgi:hypothetical protein